MDIEQEYEVISPRVIFPIYDNGKLVSRASLIEQKLEDAYIDLMERYGPYISLRYDEEEIYYTDYNWGVRS